MFLALRCVPPSRFETFRNKIPVCSDLSKASLLPAYDSLSTLKLPKAENQSSYLLCFENFLTIIYKTPTTNSNNNNSDSQITRSTAGTLHVVGFVERINMKEGSGWGERSGQINSYVLIHFLKVGSALESKAVGRSCQQRGGQRCQGWWPMFFFCCSLSSSICQAP